MGIHHRLSGQVTCVVCVRFVLMSRWHCTCCHAQVTVTFQVNKAPIQKMGTRGAVRGFTYLLTNPAAGTRHIRTQGEYIFSRVVRPPLVETRKVSSKSSFSDLIQFRTTNNSESSRKQKPSTSAMNFISISFHNTVLFLFRNAEAFPSETW